MGITYRQSKRESKQNSKGVSEIQEKIVREIDNHGSQRRELNAGESS